MIAAVVLVALLGGPAAGAPEAAIDGSPASMADLLARGWAIETRTETRERRPGLPPYEALERIVTRLEYRLARHAQRTTCVVTCDSQLDRISTDCR